MGRRFPRPAAPMCIAGHTCMADPTKPITSSLHTHSTTLSPTPHFFTFLAHLHPSCQLTPLGDLSGLLEAVQDSPITHSDHTISSIERTSHPIPENTPKNTKNTTKLSSFVLAFSPLSTTQINFVPSRKLFLRHPFILGTNFPHHSTIITPRFKLHSWEFIKNSGFQKLEGEEAWKGRGA